MGEYTEYKKLYKPANTEFVDVDKHLNYNLNIIDKYSPPLLNLPITDAMSIGSDTSIYKETGFKWWKSWSNSIWFYSSFGGVEPSSLTQDSEAFVPAWTLFTALQPGWFTQFVGDEDLRLAYRKFPVDNNGGVKVEWRGRAYRGENQLLSKTSLHLGTLPVDIRPLQEKLFMCSTGVSFGTPSIARVHFTTFGGEVWCNKQGGHVGGSEIYVDFAGISYTVYS